VIQQHGEPVVINHTINRIFDLTVLRRNGKKNRNAIQIGPSQSSSNSNIIPKTKAHQF